MNLFIMTHCGSRRSRSSKHRLASKWERADFTSVSYSVKFALNYLYLLPIGRRKNNFIMTVKCQNVVKCDLYMYIRYQMC